MKHHILCWAYGATHRHTSPTSTKTSRHYTESIGPIHFGPTRQLLTGFDNPIKGTLAQIVPQYDLIHVVGPIENTYETLRSNHTRLSDSTHRSNEVQRSSALKLSRWRHQTDPLWFDDPKTQSLTLRKPLQLVQIQKCGIGLWPLFLFGLSKPPKAKYN